jgi:hypothetical protein
LGEDAAFCPFAEIIMQRSIFGLICLLTLSGCASTFAPTAWFGAQQADHANNAVIGTMDFPVSIDPDGLRHGGMVSVRGINGKSVSRESTYIVIPPGRYTFSLYMGLGAPDLGGQASRRWSDEVVVDIVAGHVYMPDRIRKDREHSKLFMADKGPGYPLRCLPFVADPMVGIAEGPECLRQ